LLLVPLALSAVRGDSRLLGYTELLVLLTLPAASGDSGLLWYNGNLPFYTTLRLREGFIGKISFYTLSTASDLLVVWADSANSQSSLFSSFNLQQPPNLVDMPKTGFTFSHVGWMAGTEYRSYSRDTGPIRSKRQDVDADSAQGLTALALNLHQPGASVNN
jgi:hypothetical protein